MESKEDKNLKFKEVNYKLVLSLFVLYLLTLYVGVIFKFGIPVLINRSKFIITKDITLTTNFMYGLTFNLGMEPLNSFLDILYNLLLFIPLGLILPFVFKRNKIYIDLIISFLISLSIELIEAFSRLGYFNLLDILFNTLGSLIGLLITYFTYNHLTIKAITIALIVSLILVILVFIFTLIMILIHYKEYVLFFDYETYPYLI